VAALAEAGTLGAQVIAEGVERVRVEAYFPPGSPPPAGLPAGVETVSESLLPDADWLAGYREWARPIALGRRFLADPREPDAEGAGGAAAGGDGRFALRLPARRAFGTGGHESTRLAVELLEEAPVAGRRVLDVGTGTGVLAFAALLLGAAAVAAFDVDPVAVAHARANAALNRLAPRLFAGRAGALAATARFDLAIANVLPELILPDLPQVVTRLAPGGELILSGLLAAGAAGPLAAAAALGRRERSRRTAGEWLAVRLS
jgi:ribosomal protein L11 methyltransferase